MSDYCGYTAQLSANTDMKVDDSFHISVIGISPDYDRWDGQRVSESNN